MKSTLIFASAVLALGAVAAHAQGPAYSNGDLVVAFENPTGTDVEFNLGLVTALPTSGTEDFGNVSSYLTSNGQSVSSTLWSVAAGFGGSVSGVPAAPFPITVQTSSGAVSVLPAGLAISENTASQPGFVGNSATAAVTVNNSIATVGTDISAQTSTVGTSGLGLLGVAVNAAGDTASYTNQASYQNVSTDLEVTGSGSSQLWLLTSTAAGTGTGFHKANEGAINGATDLGTFALSSGGELTFTAFTAIPEPSTYAAILGALTIGFVAIRRRRAAVI